MCILFQIVFRWVATGHFQSLALKVGRRHEQLSNNPARMQYRDGIHLHGVDIAIAGFVSARLVTVEIADKGAAKDLRWVVLISDDACLPGAEYISERFFSTIAAPNARGSR
jgi:hypothetical protein